MDAANPFATPSPLPYGLPPLDRIEPGHIMPAVTAGLSTQRGEWEAIATEAAPASFANTIEALERSGQLLNRVLTVHWTQSSSLTSPEVRERDALIAPLLAQHHDALHLDGRIFARIDAVHAARHDLQLTPEAVRLVERVHLEFLRAGAALDADGQARLRGLNAELSQQVTRFRSLLVEGTTAAAVHLTDEAQLAGLPSDARSAAARAAADRGLSGWVLALELPSGQSALAQLEDRAVRERLHRASVTRCLGGPHDTRPVLAQIARLRAERAQLLGFRNHADWAIADQTAGDVRAVMATLSGMVGPAMANADGEAEELAALLAADGRRGSLQPWDWAFYAERASQRRFGVDDAVLRPYFAFERVLHDGILRAASELYGITFVPRPDLPSYHSDVRVLEVLDADGAGIGLCLIDPFARESKRGGAWMSTLSDQSRILDRRPVVTVTLNIPAPEEGTTALLTLDEVTTAFHEFGHALHGLFSDVTYPRFSGTAVPRDFVEFPSQVNEMWAFDPEILRHYAIHHETGEPLEASLARQVVSALAAGQGFATAEYLAATLLDQAWHGLTPEEVPDAGEVEAFEAEALARAGVAHPAIPPRYRSTYFSHVFGGDYHARYYAYIWSEVLDAELVEWFGERGGLRRDSGEVFRTRLLSRGGAVDPMAAFEAVRGRPPTLDPLLRRRGLTTTEA